MTHGILVHLAYQAHYELCPHGVSLLVGAALAANLQLNS